MPLLALALLAAAAPAQAVSFGSPNPGPGSLNAIPWGAANGNTSLHVYRATHLRTWGVCAGALLIDFAVASGTSGSGVYHAPQCTLAIGHLRVYPPEQRSGAGPRQDHSSSGPLDLPFTFSFPGGSTNFVHAAANGYVVLGSTSATSSSAAPTTVQLANSLPRLAPLWCDLDPAANLPANPAAGVYFEVDPGNQAVYVTWLDVAHVGLLLPIPGHSHINVQCVLHANGAFEYRYGAVVPSPQLFPPTMLVGWSQGNSLGANARMLGSIDVSTAMPFATNGPDSHRLSHDATAPILGTNLTLTVENVPNIAPLAFFVFGDAEIPELDLGFLGAPDCFAYTNASLLWVSVPVTFGTALGTGSMTVPLPDSQALAGQPLVSQAVAFTLNTACTSRPRTGSCCSSGGDRR
ncbi:MAG TPA: hypothetical protein VF384_17365 [Planctomycetota bacterium]